MMEQNPMEGKNCPPLMSVPKNSPSEDTERAKSKYSVSQPAPFKATAVELIAALISYLLAYYYVDCYMFPTYSHRWTIVAFTMLFWLGVECFCRAYGRREVSGESRFWAICMGAIALAEMLWNGTTTMVWSPLILHFIAAYWVLCRTGCLVDRRSGPMFLLDALNAMVLAPFGQFFLRVRTIWYGLTHQVVRKDAGKKLIAVLLTLLVMLPLLFFAVYQLRQADAGFDALMGQLTSMMDQFILGDWTFLGSLLVGAYLYGLVGGSLRAGGEPVLRGKTNAVRSKAEHLRVVPEIALMFSLVSFCLVYLVFFVVQLRYLAGAFRGVLPPHFTAAEFARRGFWQLCTVVVLNFALLTGTAKFCRVPLRTNKPLKGISLGLIGCNLLFAAVALCKIGVYVCMYGLTPRRVLASWFMVVLIVFSVLAVITILRPIPAARYAVLLAGGLFALLCIGNPDWFIIRGNLYLYRTGVIQELDSSVLRECGASEDQEQYRRMLYNIGWIEGHSWDELDWEFGIPDKVEDGYAYWNVGWNIIDPEMLEVRFEQQDPAEPLIAVEAKIVEGCADADCGADIQ